MIKFLLKIPGPLKFFLGIKVLRSLEDIVWDQIKHALLCHSIHIDSSMSLILCCSYLSLVKFASSPGIFSSLWWCYVFICIMWYTLYRLFTFALLHKLLCYAWFNNYLLAFMLFPIAIYGSEIVSHWYFERSWTWMWSNESLHSLRINFELKLFETFMHRSVN